MQNFRLKAAIVLGLTLSFPGIAQAQPSNPPAILTISPNEGSGLNGRARTVDVWSGRATAIDFSRVNERIIQVFLADPSRFTYATDTPLDKGEATTLFLRQILPLKFPNLTTARVTNLFVKTRATNGTVRLYTFNVQAGGATARYNGVSVATVSPIQNRQQPTLPVASSRSAQLNDIERGLQVAIARGYTSPSDPVIYKVREFLVKARNASHQSWNELAQTLQIPLPVLTQLANLGTEASRDEPARVVNPKLVRFN